MTTYNEVVKALSQAIAESEDYRAVIDFHGEHEGDTMLIDFSSCGEPFTDPETVCIWSYQRELKKDGQYAGTEELDYGILKSYAEVFTFITKTLNENEGELYVESF